MNINGREDGDATFSESLPSSRPTEDRQRRTAKSRSTDQRTDSDKLALQKNVINAAQFTTIKNVSHKAWAEKYFDR